MDKIIIEKYVPNELEMEEFERNLEIYFDLFINDCLGKGEFSEIKEDYFKI